MKSEKRIFIHAIHGSEIGQEFPVWRDDCSAKKISYKVPVEYAPKEDLWGNGLRAFIYGRLHGLLDFKPEGPFLLAVRYSKTKTGQKFMKYFNGD